MTSSCDKRQQDHPGIPLEIDTHYELYGKHAWEVQYGERCPNCNKRIDEFGFCACGAA
ncbi:MAG: hypothetical protein ACJ70M_07800 [Nitrososphaera sp.]|jgi:hypothetical protein